MSKKWYVIWFIVIGMMVLLIPVVIPARAQDPTPENDANCVTCHEHQYYVYDSGKWFCLCEAPMHCVYCHGGRTDSNKKEIAHEGLVLYPTRNHAERCQTCHTEDYMSRVVTFETVAGVRSTPISIITATPGEPVFVSEGQAPATFLTRFSHFETWRQVGLIFLGIALVVIIVFGYRCWKADCLSKTRL